MKKIITLTIILLNFCFYSLYSQGAWIQKANFGGSARVCAVGFSIGTKGYIGTGYDGTNYKQDF